MPMRPAMQKLSNVIADRNNIAAVRLAGLQDELNLSSTQYQVSLEVKETLAHSIQD
jgi:hypothetical protein